MKIFLVLIFLLVFVIFGTSAYAQELKITKIVPIDDAFVLADVHDITHEHLDFPSTNTGDLEYLKAWYSWNATIHQEHIITINYMKFNLTELSEKTIKNAYLNLTPIKAQIRNSTEISLVYIPNNKWDESTITFEQRPRFGEDIINIKIPEQKYKWDITEFVKKDQGFVLSFVFFFKTLFENDEEILTFYSKETIDQDNAPFLEVQYTDEVYTRPFSQTTLISTADTYAIANFNDPEDIDGIRKKNFGDKDDLIVSYSWSTTELNEFNVSQAFLQFDLIEIGKDVSKAQLNLFVKETDFENDSTAIILNPIENPFWNELELNYSNKPDHDENQISKAEINKDSGWYSWDVTDYIKSKAGSSISFMMDYETLSKGNAEKVVFSSKESPDRAPYLEIEFGLDDTATDATTEGGGCLIATATYGTELAPQVQQLRELRDNTLLQTNSGILFMESFNEFYYSFSPYIADYERENPAFKETVKLAITPLVSSLAILNYLDIDSEEKMLGYGIGIILLNIGMYFVAPAIVIMRLRK